MTHTNVMQRCYNPNTTQFHRYGGRGINVCLGWQDFETWFREFGQFRPSTDYTIDRVDNDGGYWCGHCKECVSNSWPMNCAWELQQAQTWNRSTTKFLTFKDQTRSIGEWAKITGLRTNTIWGRIKDGWPVEDILTLPVFAKNEFRKSLIKPDALQNRDLSNQRFGRLVALTSERRGHIVVWHCVCDCGAVTTTRALRLVKGESRSCGNCVRRKERGRVTSLPANAKSKSGLSSVA